MTFSKTISGAFLTALIALGVSASLGGHVTAQSSGTNFQAGHIIDDQVFYDSNAMNPQQILAFLKSKLPADSSGNPACDTNGDKPYYGTYGSTTYNGNILRRNLDTNYPAPYTCLYQYVEDTKIANSGAKGSGGNNVGNPTWTPPASDCPVDAAGINTCSAAYIIYNAAKQYSISPKVLIILLQKEQFIVTDDWPWYPEYKSATGYGCPDTAACDSTYFGLYNQVHNAAKQFRLYASNPNAYNYTTGVNQILFHYPRNITVNGQAVDCGMASITIQNLATAGLYNYTPYVPNQAALNNMYGLGDACSAYGNRNFWRYYNDWFGPTLASGLPGCAEATNTARACIWSLYNPANLDQFMTSSVQVRDDLVVNKGYQFVSRAYWGNVIPLPGNIAVYRASVVGGGSFLTTNQGEYNALVAAGYSGDGIDFYADPAWSNSGSPVFRLYNSTSHQHYWTADTQQRQTFLQNGYSDEGIAFASISPTRQEAAPTQGHLLVYRFYVATSHSHFWTTDVNERDSLIQAGYQYEGVAWNSSSDTTKSPVYRLYAPGLRQHLYTTSPSERDALVAAGGWAYETISQYVTMTPNSLPVYRLYAPSLGAHILTTDANERQKLIGTGNWNDEGVAWYLP